MEWNRCAAFARECKCLNGVDNAVSTNIIYLHQREPHVFNRAPTLLVLETCHLVDPANPARCAHASNASFPVSTCQHKNAGCVVVQASSEMRRWAQHGCASRISLPSHFKQASVVSSAASCFGTVRIRKYFLRFHTSWTPRSSLSGPIPCPTNIPSRNSIQGTLDSLAKTLNCDRDSLRAYASAFDLALKLLLDTSKAVSVFYSSAFQLLPSLHRNNQEDLVERLPEFLSNTFSV